VQDRLDIDTHLEDQFKAHLSRGVLLLYQRVKDIKDLAPLVKAQLARPRRSWNS